MMLLCSQELGELLQPGGLYCFHNAVVTWRAYWNALWDDVMNQTVGRHRPGGQLSGKGARTLYVRRILLCE